MLSVSPNEVFFPIPSEMLLVDYSNSKDILINLFDQMHNFSTNLQSTYKNSSNLINALNVAKILLISVNGGGKIIGFNSSESITESVSNKN